MTRRDFTIPEGHHRQILFEVFYDAQFYDLELLIESKDAGELKNGANTYMQKSDMTKFKGARRLVTDLEHGDYTFLVIAKLPGVSGDTTAYAPVCFEFQLYSVTSTVLKNHAMIANSLNLFGLLGPEGRNFGQMLTVIPMTKLQPQETVEFTFTLSEESDDSHPFLDIQIIDADGKGDQLDIKLYEVNRVNITDVFTLPDGTKSKQSVPIEKLNRPHSSRYFDDWEEGVSFLALASGDLSTNKEYRIVIKNRDAAAVV